jgi:hypothetical protein
MISKGEEGGEKGRRREEVRDRKTKRQDNRERSQGYK